MSGLSQRMWNLAIQTLKILYLRFHKGHQTWQRSDLA